MCDVSYYVRMQTLKILTALGGRKQVIAMTGLHRATISYWTKNKNGIPKAWLLYFQEKFPDLPWQELRSEPRNTEVNK